MDEITQNLLNNLNKRTIHPEKDYDLLLEELQKIGLYFDYLNKKWYIENK